MILRLAIWRSRGCGEGGWRKGIFSEAPWLAYAQGPKGGILSSKPASHNVIPNGCVTPNMAHFAIIRIHLIRRVPPGGRPWLWPFSILLGGTAVLTYLWVGVGASPSHPPWKTSLPGGCLAEFWLLHPPKCTPSKIEENAFLPQRSVTPRNGRFTPHAKFPTGRLLGLCGISR